MFYGRSTTFSVGKRLWTNKTKHFGASCYRKIINFGVGTPTPTPRIYIFIYLYNVIVFPFLKGYMTKKGHKRKNWTERWFELCLDSISYYVSEDLTEKKGSISLDRHCCVEVRTQRGLCLKCNAVQVTLKCSLFSAFTRQRRKEKPLYHQMYRQKPRDQRLGQKETAGVDPGYGNFVTFPVESTTLIEYFGTFPFP